MKRQRDEIRKSVGCAVLLLTGVFMLFSACSQDPRLDALIQMEDRPVELTSDERIQELRDTIEEYEAIVNQKVQAAVREASYLKLLAQEYLRNELYGPALDTLDEALRIEPRNKVLHYYAGISAAYVGKAQTRDEARAQYFAISERAYLSALEIDANYRDALFALGTLYHFEMGRNLDAVQVLERLIDQNPSHTPGLFVLARANAALGNVDDAVAAYDRIIEEASDSAEAAQARRNRQLLLGEVQ